MSMTDKDHLWGMHEIIKDYINALHVKGTHDEATDRTTYTDILNDDTLTYVAATDRTYECTKIVNHTGIIWECHVRDDDIDVVVDEIFSFTSPDDIDDNDIEEPF